MRNASLFLYGLILLVSTIGCTSTTSYTPGASGAQNGPGIAVFPFKGPYGDQAADMVAQQFLTSGYNIVDTPRVNRAILFTGFDPQVVSSAELSRLHASLGADYLITGTVSANRGPLSSYEHVNMTTRLIDARSGKILWIGTYGNPMWSSAMSTQGDLQRGALHTVREFNKTYGRNLKAIR